MVSKLSHFFLEMSFTPQGRSSGSAPYYEKVDDVHDAVMPQNYEQPIALTNKVLTSTVTRM